MSFELERRIEDRIKLIVFGYLPKIMTRCVSLNLGYHDQIDYASISVFLKCCKHLENNLQ